LFLSNDKINLSKEDEELILGVYMKKVAVSTGVLLILLALFS